MEDVKRRDEDDEVFNAEYNELSQALIPQSPGSACRTHNTSLSSQTDDPGEGEVGGRNKH